MKEGIVKRLARWYDNFFKKYVENAPLWGGPVTPNPRRGTPGNWRSYYSKSNGKKAWKKRGKRPSKGCCKTFKAKGR
jgi:hypothetical protein